jgi:hypothetical protein
MLPCIHCELLQVLILENGEVRRDGKGVYTTADGDVYVGEYVAGMRHGQGTV